MKEKYKIPFVVLVTAIIIISTFVVVIETGIIKLDALSTGGDRPLFLKIFVEENSGTIPFAINFTSLVLYQEGDVSYKWDFGDGNTSNEINPTYIYTENGTFNCSLTITDGAGRKISDIIKITVSANQGPVPTIVFSDRAPSRPYVPFLWKRGISVNFDGQKLKRWMDLPFFPTDLLNKMFKSFVSVEGRAYDPEGDEIVSYEWELRPAAYSTRIGELKKLVYPFTGQTVEFPFLCVYPTGRYELTLIVTDDKGNKGYRTELFTVHGHSIENFRNSFTDNIADARGALWHDLFKDDFGGPVTNVIASIIFPLLKFPLLKLFIIFKLINWDISIGSSEIIEELLQRHPALRKITESILQRIQSVFVKLKYKFPKLEGISDKIIDSIQQTLEKLGLDNKRPELSDPFPSDESKNIPRDCQYVSITVTDPEGDRFNVTISGDYVNDISYDNVTNGVFNATLITPLPPRTNINWHVKVVDLNGKVVEVSYKFTTFS
jgi:PKD repeat protein